MFVLNCSLGDCVYLEPEDFFEDRLVRACNDFEYVYAEVAEGESCSIVKQLNNKCFRFADRYLCVDYRLAFNEALNTGNKLAYEFSDSWDIEDIYSIGKNYFSQDPRFFPHKERTNEVENEEWTISYKNDQIKDELLYEYIKLLKARGYHACLSKNGNELVGFNIWKEDDLKSARIILGAVSLSYKSTGAAMALYRFTMNTMASRDVSVLKQQVSTANTASLNLHMLLEKNDECRRCKIKGFKDIYWKG